MYNRNDRGSVLEDNHTLANPSWGIFSESFILEFALWTVFCHLTVFVKGSLWDLIILFSFTNLLLCIWWWKKRQKSDHSPQAAPARKREGRGQRIQQYLIWILVVVAVIITLIANRPDPDDSRYINRAVFAAANPTAPILQRDTMHLIPDGRIKPTSKFLSNEMLAATLSLLTGIPAIYFFHIVFLVLGAILSILAYGELFRILAPRHWAYGVLGVMVFLFANGQKHHAYGNFSFVRLQQGKGFLVSVFIPLIIVYSLRFVSHSTRRNWLLLCSVQIAAVGVSSTGLMIAPTVATFALLTGILGKRIPRRHTRLLLGILTSIYVVAIGFSIRLPYLIKTYTQAQRTKQFMSTRMANEVTERADLPPKRRTRDSKGIIEKAEYRRKSQRSVFSRTVENVFGNGRSAIVSLIILLSAWLWCETSVARRLCLVFPIAFCLIFANPFTAHLVERYITQPGFYWRVFWILPLPVMAGLTLLAPLSMRLPKRGKYSPGPPQGGQGGVLSLKEEKFSFIRYGLYVFLLVLMITVISERSIFSKANRTSIEFPGLKVTPEYQIARAIDDLFDDRPNILAPESVSLWLPTLHQHPYPLLARFIYAYHLDYQVQEHMALMKYIMGEQRRLCCGLEGEVANFLSESLQHYQIAGVCIPQSNPWLEEIRDVLRESSYEKRQELLSHEIWVLDRSQ